MSCQAGEQLGQDKLLSLVLETQTDAQFDCVGALAAGANDGQSTW
jgi:hypothetical protein